MKLDEQIDTIMDEFDFDRVLEIMAACNWGWSTGEGDETEIPSGNEIRKTARRMLKQTVEEKHSLMSSGGFTVMKIRGRLYLFFGVDSTSIEFADNDNI
jgi:hypothetical protein